MSVATGESLRLAIMRATPIRAGWWWQRFQGLTAWSVSWSFRQVQSSKGGCEVADLRVGLETEITLPALMEATAADRLVFDGYVAALKVHELGHLEIARKAAEQVLSGLQSLDRQADCPALEARAQEVTDAAIAAAKVVEKRYDVDTGYGRTQGVTLER